MRVIVIVIAICILYCSDMKNIIECRINKRISLSIANNSAASPPQRFGRNISKFASFGVFGLKINSVNRIKIDTLSFLWFQTE